MLSNWRENIYFNLLWNELATYLCLLTGNLPSYDAQIKKAFVRKDMVSVNHRTAAFLESYFDIIFALNKLTHPGEKRIVQYARAQAEILSGHTTYVLTNMDEGQHISMGLLIRIGCFGFIRGTWILWNENKSDIQTGRNQ